MCHSLSSQLSTQFLWTVFVATIEADEVVTHTINLRLSYYIHAKSGHYSTYEKSCWSHFNSPSLCRSSSSCWHASWAAASAPTSPDAASSPSTAAPTPSGAAAPVSGFFQLLSLVNITASRALGPASAPSSRPPTCHTA